MKHRAFCGEENRNYDACLKNAVHVFLPTYTK